MYSEKNHLIKHTVPKTVLLKHYVFFRLALRRYDINCEAWQSVFKDATTILCLLRYSYQILSEVVHYRD